MAFGLRHFRYGQRDRDRRPSLGACPVRLAWLLNLTLIRALDDVPASHQAGVAANVCGQNRRQFELLTGHGNFPRFLQRIVENLGPIGNQVEKA